MPSVMGGAPTVPESDALNLLAAIGNPEKSKQMIDSIVDEKKKAAVAKAEAEQVRQFAEAELAKMNAKAAELVKQEESLNKKEKALDTKIATFQTNSQAEADGVAQERFRLQQLSNSLISRESEINKKEGSLTDRETFVKAEEDRIAKLQAELDSRVASIKAQVTAELNRQLAAIG